jgi:hypothetical protein
MAQFLRQIIEIFSLNYIKNTSRYIFILINTIPLIAYLTGETTPESIIDFFIADIVIVILFNLIYIKGDVFFYSGILFLLVVFSITLLYLSLVYIPFNSISSRQVTFYNFIAIVFIIYSCVFILRGKEAFEVDQSFYKWEIIKRFVILLFISILGYIIDDYFKNYSGYVLAIVSVKMILDFYLINKNGKLIYVKK